MSYDKVKNLLAILILFGLVFVFKQGMAQNNAIEFDGINDYINIPTLELTEYTNISMEAWVYAKSFNPLSPDAYISNIVGHVNAAALLRIGDIDIENNRPQFVIADTYGIHKLNANSLLNANTWYHLAVTYGGGYMKLYINGILDNSLSVTPSYIVNTDNFISIGGSTSDRYLEGKIDEVRIWNDVRTEQEIRTNMYREIINPGTDMIAYYKLNESDGTTTATDTKGTFDGTLVNMSGNEWLTSSAMFGPKKCLDLDGINDYISIPASSSINNPQFSVEFWIKMNDVPAFYDGIIDKGRNNSRNWYFLTIQNYLGVIFGIPGAGEIWMGLNDNEWHHIAGTFNGTVMSAYLDGILCYAVTGTMTLESTYDINIGRWRTGQNPFNGKIDEIRIWNDERTANEIRENMCNSLTGNEANLVAYYTCDNTSGTKLQDVTGNGNDGTLINMNNADWETSTSFNTWLNTTSTDWATTTNWSSETLPSTKDNIGIIYYSGGYQPTLAGSPTINNLVIGSSAQLTMSTGMTVNRNLILESNLNLNSQTIVIGSTGTLVEDNGILYSSTDNGSIMTTRVLNNINENVGGLGAEISTAQNMGTTIITRGFALQIGGGNTGIKRFYEISPTNNSGLNATFVFHYSDTELNGITETNLELYQSSNEGSTWTQIGGTVNTVSNTITASGLNSLYRWTSGDKNYPMPVEISTFTATSVNGIVMLNWKTESEINNSGFDIERKAENSNWKKIDFIKGAGTINSPQVYNYTDRNLASGKYNYRLKQIDHNGNFNYFKLNTDVVVGIPTKFELSQNYPNPFNPHTKIRFELPHDSRVSIKIFDILGRELATLVDSKKEAGYYTIDFDGSKLASGIYLYTMQTEGFKAVKKMTLLK